MSKSTTARTLFLLSTLLLSACIQPSTAKDESAGGGEGGEGGEGGGGPGSGEATAIYDIQMNTFDEGTVVTIKDVVVTSQLIEGDYPAFFVQSPEGGEYNGIYIFKYDEVEYTPTIGDIVTITGEYSEFYDNSQLVVTGASDIELTGTGGEVVVTEIDAEPDNWEAYESVVVQINDAEIADASKLYEWGAVQLTIGCWLDNVFTNYDAEDGATYTSVTGPLTYSFEKYSVLPRSGADFGDYDGTAGGGQGGGEISDATVTDVQTGAVAEYASVNLSGVITTSGLTFNGKGFYVQDGGGGAYSGVYIYIYEEVAEAIGDIEEGLVMNITGQVKEYYGLTEIEVTDASNIEITGSGSTTTDWLDATPSDWEAWEGCLVEVENVSVTSDEDEYGAADTSHGIKLDDDLSSFDVSSGDDFSAVTGLVSYSHDAFRLLPRSSADFTD